MNFDMPAQRLLISALKTQIHLWETRCEDVSLLEANVVNFQHDIDHARLVLTQLEEQFHSDFGQHPD
jgi:hypothetical protein